MIQILIGLALLIGGPVVAVFLYKKFDAAATEMQYMQTTPIAEAIELVEGMAAADPSYRHYVEIKGVIHSEEPVQAPFCGKQVAYYRNQCYSVNEETKTEKDSSGNIHTKVVKKEDRISDEKSPVPTYIRDASSETPVYIDIESFGGDFDLQPGCDRFEPHNSPWLQQNVNYFSRWNHYSQARFLGYRLKEQIMALNQPVYALGELYSSNGRYYIGKSFVGKKQSKLTYKTEDQLVHDTKNNKLIALAVGAGCAVAGIVMIIAGL